MAEYKTSDTPTSGGAMLGNSPKSMYVFFLLGLCRDYFSTMKSSDKESIDSATAALIAFCPNGAKRKELWEEYSNQKISNGDSLFASVYVVGELISYLSEILEFEEQSTGGLL